MTPPRRKRVWTVSDFALHAYGDNAEPACRRARRLLVRLDAKHNGALLLRTPGTNREYTFLPAVLAKLEPNLFEPVESLEFRVDELENVVGEGLDAVKADQRRLATQIGANTRAIEGLRRRGRPAA